MERGRREGKRRDREEEEGGEGGRWDEGERVALFPGPVTVTPSYRAWERG